MEKLENIKETVADKVEDVAYEHPAIFTGILYGIGMAIMVPVTIASYKFLGKTAGIAAANEIKKLL